MRLSLEVNLFGVDFFGIHHKNLVIIMARLRRWGGYNILCVEESRENIIKVVLISMITICEVLLQFFLALSSYYY